MEDLPQPPSLQMVMVYTLGFGGEVGGGRHGVG